MIEHSVALECQGRGSLHFNTVVWSGLALELLQALATGDPDLSDLKAKAAEVLDSMATTKLDTERHARRDADLEERLNGLNGNAGPATLVGREVGPLHPRGLAPKRLRDEIIEQDCQGKQQQKRRGRGRGGAERKEQSNDKWSMPGFSADLGGAGLVADRYTVKAVQSQVTLQGTAGREPWLSVDLLRGGGWTKVIGWMQSGEL